VASPGANGAVWRPTSLIRSKHSGHASIDSGTLTTKGTHSMCTLLPRVDRE
jgi:hypothetical protein